MTIMDGLLKEKWADLWKKSHGSVYQSVEWVEALEKSGKSPILVTTEGGGKLKSAIAGFESKVRFLGITKKTITCYGSPLHVKKGDELKILEKLKNLRGYIYKTIAPFPGDNPSIDTLKISPISRLSPI